MTTGGRESGWSAAPAVDESGRQQPRNLGHVVSLCRIPRRDRVHRVTTDKTQSTLFLCHVVICIQVLVSQSVLAHLSLNDSVRQATNIPMRQMRTLSSERGGGFPRLTEPASERWSQPRSPSSLPGSVGCSCPNSQLLSVSTLRSQRRLTPTVVSSTEISKALLQFYSPLQNISSIRPKT